MSFGPSRIWPPELVGARSGSPTGSRVLKARRLSNRNVPAAEALGATAKATRRKPQTNVERRRKGLFHRSRSGRPIECLIIICLRLMSKSFNGDDGGIFQESAGAPRRVQATHA